MHSERGVEVRGQALRTIGIGEGILRARDDQRARPEAGRRAKPRGGGELAQDVPARHRPLGEIARPLLRNLRAVLAHAGGDAEDALLARRAIALGQSENDLRQHAQVHAAPGHAQVGRAGVDQHERIEIIWMAAAPIHRHHASQRDGAKAPGAFARSAPPALAQIFRDAAYAGGTLAIVFRAGAGQVEALHFSALRSERGAKGAPVPLLASEPAQKQPSRRLHREPPLAGGSRMIGGGSGKRAAIPAPAPGGHRASVRA